MTDIPRYAIYYAAAADSELDRFGAHLLGYDAFRGEDLPFPGGIEHTMPDWRDLTRDPRKYGFHATLKAPMLLADGKTEQDLLAACKAFAGLARPIPVISPVVNAIGDFIAIVPAHPSAELQQLAADAVTGFENFRAPLTPQDRARRNPERLSPKQREYLDRWGYPYVMEEFRFHMTLTGRLPADRGESVLAVLRQRFSDLPIVTLAVDRITLLRQDDPGSRFRVLRDFGLTPA
jgi:putative phosphonate metabolism protein